MATPQETITTVSGRRCTRSRARTAASSTALASDPPQVTPTDFTSSTTTSELQQVQTSEAAAAPPQSSSQDDTAAAAPTSEQAPPATGTDSPVSSVAQSAPLANIQPSPPAAAAPDPGAVVSDEAASEPTTAPAVSASAAVPPTTPTSSDSNDIAVTSASSITSTASGPSVPLESSVDPPPDQPEESSQPASPPERQPDDEPPQPTSSETPASIVGPDSDPGQSPNLTIASDGNTNVGAIAGGVIGGFAAIALISVLLFLCLRKRKSRGRWHVPALNEKGDNTPGIFAKLKGASEKLRAIPAGAGALVAKVKGTKSGPPQNPYNRQSVRSSVSSVYSAHANHNRRSQSMSEPPSKFRQQLRGFGDRMPSLKRSKTLLQKKPDSFVNGNQSPFAGIVDDPVLRNSKDVDNPFADPLEPPKMLQLLNPDPNSREGTPKPQRDIQGLLDQQRAPISPKPVLLSDRGSRDPFASILEELDARDGSGTPEWLRESSHKRTQSAATALRSHPPSTYTASVYTTADNPFWDPSDAPPVPQQALPPNPPKGLTTSYAAGLPQFNATSTAGSRDSDGSFYFGEPGPSRPSTNLFSEVSAIPRVGRQSDPFDLDRPEVLGFGQVGGRREVNGSMTRQNSRNKRASSVPNWVNFDDGPYERTSAVPGPLRRGPSFRR